jgi:hypothetical protein
MPRRARLRLVVIACLGAFAVLAVHAADIPGLQGRAALAAPDLDFELREAALSTTGSDLWVVASARPRGKPTGVESMWLATFAPGRDVVRTALALPGADASAGAAARPGRRLLGDVAATRDGRLAFALAPGPNPSSIALLRRDARELEAARPVVLPSSDVDVQQLVQSTGGQLLALGVANNRPFVAEIAGDGKTVWQQPIAADPALIDMGRPTRDGGVIVVGRRGLNVDAQEVWIAKLSARGGLERSMTVAARGGAVAPLAGGGYGVITWAAGARGFDVTLRAITDDMRERWSKSLIADQVNPAFDIAATPSGGFIVAGSKDRGLWVTNYDADGGVIWTDHRVPQPPDVEMVFNLQLIARGDTFVLPYTAFTLEGREQRQSVRVLTFVVK